MHLAFPQYVRWLLDNKYTVDPDGLPGNDDYGETGHSVCVRACVRACVCVCAMGAGYGGWRGATLFIGMHCIEWTSGTTFCVYCVYTNIVCIQHNLCIHS